MCLRETQEGEMSNYIDESTHLQLIEAVKAHREVIEALQARTGHPLSYAEMHVIRHGTQLEDAARFQVRRAGILPPAPVGAKS